METEKFAKPNGAVSEEIHSMPTFAEIRQTVRRSDDVKELVIALIKAQKGFAAIVKDSENEAYTRGSKKSKYATLAAVVDATRPSLNENGLTILQHVQSNNVTRETIITTTLVHVSGQFWESDLTMPSVNQQNRFDPQTVASATTYGRRVAWLGICGAAPEDDDDGNAASGVGSKEAAQEVARRTLEEKQHSPDPKIRQLATDGLAAIRAKEQAKALSLEPALKASLASVVPKAHIPLDDSLAAAKDDGLFDEVSGTIQEIRQMQTSAAKGNRPYRRIAITTMERGELVDMSISAFDNFQMSDGKCFDFLDEREAEGSTARLVIERKGKFFNLKDIKQLGRRTWDARVGAIQQELR